MARGKGGMNGKTPKVEMGKWRSTTSSCERMRLTRPKRARAAAGRGQALHVAPADNSRRSVDAFPAFNTWKSSHTTHLSRTDAPRDSDSASRHTRAIAGHAARRLHPLTG